MFRRPLISGFLFLLLMACTDDPTTTAAGSAEPSGSEPVAEAEPIVGGDCQLVMGWDPYEPYQYADPDNNVRGLDVELVSEMARQAGCALRFAQKDWASLMSDLRGGSVSLLAGASKVAERENFALFSQPYRQEMFALYIRAGESERWQSDTLAALVSGQNKMRIGITDGYIYGADIDQLLDDAALGKQFVTARFSEAHADNLIEKRIDGMLEDPFVASSMIRRKNLADEIIRSGLQIKTGEVSLMFSKASVSPATVQAFDAALVAMRTDGRYDQIVKRYLP